MPTLDLRDPELRQEAGLITETVSIPSQSSGAPANGRDRGETMQCVVELLHEHGPLTRNQLARHLGRTKSQWLNGIFEQMAAEGQIRRGHTITRNGLTAIIYGVEE